MQRRSIKTKAIICNKAHPEWGCATIPLPIPDEEYAHCMELLEQMQIGGVTASDCYIDQLNDAPPYELKSIPKGSFVVMKTGTHPMRTRLRLFLEWGITFGEPYILPERAAREVAYADKQTLMRKIRESSSTPAPVSEQEAGEQERSEADRRAPRQSAYWYGKKEAPP